jgi:hypothetical protein
MIQISSLLRLPTGPSTTAATFLSQRTPPTTYAPWQAAQVSSKSYVDSSTQTDDVPAPSDWEQTGAESIEKLTCCHPDVTNNVSLRHHHLQRNSSIVKSTGLLRQSSLRYACIHAAKVSDSPSLWIMPIGIFVLFPYLSQIPNFWLLLVGSDNLLSLGLLHRDVAEILLDSRPGSLGPRWTGGWWCWRHQGRCGFRQPSWDLTLWTCHKVRTFLR